jgi:oligopeptide transport system permease protein
MPTFILRRFLSSIVVLLCVVSITFLLSRAQKGGPFERERMTPEAKAKKERQYELDGPAWWQLQRYLGKVFLHADLGVSIRYTDRTVTEILAQKMPNSIKLGGCAFLIASLGGVALGFAAAMRKDSALDVSCMFFALGAVSVPTFITGPLMIAVFGLWLRWLPVGGWGNLKQILMPSVCLALPYLAYVSRLTRNSLLEVMSQNYMRTAKAKGLGEATALFKHALKIALLPVITYLGPMAAYVLTGSFIIESVFNISGAGSLFVNAIQNVDPFLLTGAVSVYCAAILFFNFIVDVLYGVLDKRIQLNG